MTGQLLPGSGRRCCTCHGEAAAVNEALAEEVLEHRRHSAHLHGWHPTASHEYMT